MNYKIYIESVNNFPLDDWAVSAYLGFRNKGSDIILFEDIEEVPFSKWNIVVACIQTTNKYFERKGIPPKKALNIPIELEKEKYLGRKINRTYMELFRNFQIPKEGIFIKPDGISKEFIAGVVKRQEDVNMFFANIPGTSPILLSEPVNFISEYRGYVIDKKLVGLYWYSGDFKIFPDVKIIEEAIEDYTSQPAGYSIDFGITDEGRTLLVECNDGWSLGNYGLENGKYCKLLTNRWLEMMKSY